MVVVIVVVVMRRCGRMAGRVVSGTRGRGWCSIRNNGDKTQAQGGKIVGPVERTDIAIIIVECKPQPASIAIARHVQLNSGTKAAALE